MNAYKQTTSKIGLVKYAHTLKTELYEGTDTNKYSIMIAFDDDERARIEQEAQHEYDKFKELPENKGKRFPAQLQLAGKEFDDGKFYFKFKQTHIIKMRDGREFEKHIAIFDSHNKPVKLQDEIGNGSKVRVCFEYVPYATSAKGVTLRVVGLQLIDYKPYRTEATAQDMGFGEVADGYVAEETENDEVPVQFGASNEGDF